MVARETWIEVSTMDSNPAFSPDLVSIQIAELPDNTPYFLFTPAEGMKLEQFDMVRVTTPDIKGFYRGMVHTVYETDVCIQVDRGQHYWQ